MFLRDKTSGDLVEVVDLSDLFDPCQDSLIGCFHAGEEMQENQSFSKVSLVFPSGESLPQCWTDPHYRD